MIRRNLLFPGLVFSLFFLTLLAGCSSLRTAAPTSPVDLNVSAAASLTDVLKEVNTIYSRDKAGITIVPNFASSGTLQTQIENGAPVDVFISAAAVQMDNLEKENLLLDNTRRNLLYNRVVLIVPADSSLGITSFYDLASYRVKRIAIGDPGSVPAGIYARQTLELLGIAAQVQAKEILGSDVRQVLTYVESGNVDAGIVYSTDALISKNVKIVARAPDEINAKVVYPVAVIEYTKVASAAGDYINFLFSTKARQVFEKHGFIVAGR